MTKRRRLVTSLLFAVLISSSTTLGQVSLSTTTVTVPNCSGGGTVSYDVDVYQPATTGPHALVGVAHGFQLSKEGMGDVARALAKQGAVVVVPQFPLLLRFQCGSTDHARNADILWEAMSARVAAGGIDSTKLGAVGHSAGALSAWGVASSQSVAAVALLDPTDSNGLGASASAAVSAPALFVFAPPAQCNSQGNATPWFDAKPGSKARLRIVGAGHCDAQSPSSSTCTAACGGAGSVSATRQALFVDWASAFFSVTLHGAPRCLASEAQQAAMAGVVDAVDFRLGPCASGNDGGSDAGSDVDAGAADDAGVSAPDAGVEPMTDAGVVMSPDAGVPKPGDDGGVVPPAGCGCGNGGALMLLGVLLTLRATRRRA